MSSSVPRTPTETRNFLQAGDMLAGRYEIVRVLGQGGFATVYEARQINIDRRVAIKVLEARPRLGQEEVFRERFLREAKVAARIEHPNVVTIYDYDLMGRDGHPYIVMEFLDGHDLETEVQRGPMAAARVLPLFLGALDALAVGHRMNVVHKDLKPSNLFLRWPGQRRESLCVLDFGIARTTEESGHQLTKTGEMVGTPHYMAPEYINAQIATPALDVYQMGLILIEALTGQPVVNENTPMLCLMRHSMGNLQFPAELMTSPLGPVLKKALAHDHTRRYPDAEAFIEALSAVELHSIPAVSRASLAATSGAHVLPFTTDTMGRPNTDQLQRPGWRKTVDESMELDATEESAGLDATVDTAGFDPTVDATIDTDDTVRAPTSFDVVANPSSPSPTMVGGKRSWWIGAAILAALVLAGGVAVGLSIGGDPPSMPRDMPAPVQDEPVAPVPVKVTVITDPAGAEVRVGDELLGRAPVVLSFGGPDDGPREISVSLEGYEPTVREVRPSEGHELHLTLHPNKPPAGEPQAPVRPVSTPIPEARRAPASARPKTNVPVRARRRSADTPLPIID